MLDSPMRYSLNSSLLAVGAGAVLVGALPAKAQSIHSVKVIERVLESLRDSKGLPLDARKSAREIMSYYAAADSRTLWIGNRRGERLIEALTALQRDGLFNSQRSVKRLQTMRQAMRSLDSSFLALGEIVHSAHFYELASDLRLGQMRLYRARLHPRTLARKISAKALLDRVLEGIPLVQVLEDIQPQEKEYQAIKKRLAELLSLRSRGGWVPVRPGSPLRIGMSHDRVKDIRARLAAGGELADANQSSKVYDKALAAAVRLFQRRHNLRPSGTLNRSTVLAMNVPWRQRVQQLQVNLERWRWFGDVPSNNRWIINTAAKRLFWRRRATIQKNLRITINRSCQVQAAFNTVARRIVANPKYNLSKREALRYVLPVLKSNPSKLDTSFAIYGKAPASQAPRINWRNYNEADFPFSVIQQPGPSNPLGSFQIYFDEIDSVSLHGLPTVRAFPKIRQACVGVPEKTLNLADLLPVYGFAQPSLAAQPSQSGNPLEIRLKSPISVVFIYATIWVGRDGEVVFGADPLGRDAKLGRLILRRI
ncbi:MAG: peptidoglycan-binding protein [Anderseniella sp.]